jgi:hypothetical protein
MPGQAFTKATKTNSAPTTAHNRPKAKMTEWKQVTHDDNDEEQLQT